ncbi:hypothetical protein C1645_821850, partial [Glomus cerebriforme]
MDKQFKTNYKNYKSTNKIKFINVTFDKLFKWIKNKNKAKDLIEEEIRKKHIPSIEHHHFSDIQEIGKGNFAVVYRAKYKKSEQYFALKSFFNATIKEIVDEITIHRKVNLYDNIIRFHGITINQGKYLLVLEYADG